MEGYVFKIKKSVVSRKVCINWFYFYVHTGKSLPEALIFASTNPRYDDILFIELQVEYMKIPSAEHVRSFFFCRTLEEHVVYRNSSECQKQFLHTTCSSNVLQIEEFLTKFYLYQRQAGNVCYIWREISQSQDFKTIFSKILKTKQLSSLTL